MEHKTQSRKYDLSEEELEIKKAFDSNGANWVIGREEPVLISYVVNPNEIYIQRQGAPGAISLLQSYLSAILDSNPRAPSKVHPHGTFLYQKNDATGKKQYYRIYIQAADRENFTGILLDTGESPIPVQEEELLHCSSFIRQLKSLSVKASLFGISLSKGKWNEELYKSLRNYLLSPKVRFVANVAANEKPLLITLSDQLGSLLDVFAQAGDPNVITYNTKEVSYEEIPYNQLHKGKKYDGKVVHLDLGLNFYYVLTSDYEKYEEGRTKIQEIYHKRPRLKASPESMSVVIGRSTSDSNWMRCLVLEKKAKGGGSTLMDIDSGKTLTNVKEVYKVHEDVAFLPSYVHFCQLWGYDALDEDKCFLGRTLIEHEDVVDLLVKDVKEDALHSVDIYP